MSNFGCNCHPVAYPHVVELDYNYMDEQYAFLEELVRRSTFPDFKPSCRNFDLVGDLEFPDAGKRFAL